jgi:DNA-binding protein
MNVPENGNTSAAKFCYFLLLKSGPTTTALFAAIILLRLVHFSIIIELHSSELLGALMDKHVEIRVTQNGKTRNYISKVVEVLTTVESHDEVTGNVPTRVTLSATGRCINKLVTIVEVVKSLLSKDLHQYTVMGTFDHTVEQDNNEQQDTTQAPPPLKSQLFITLCNHKLPDMAACGYQHHTPMPGVGGTSVDAVGTASGNEQAGGQGGQGMRLASDDGSSKRKHGRRCARGQVKVKKKDLEDSKNVLY